jgi:CubicO group peptidase (beta-lactamase class C family)
MRTKMTPQMRVRSLVAAMAVALAAACSSAQGPAPAAAQGPYFPPKGEWERKAPAEVGMDAARLDAALKFAETRETDWPKNFATQEQIFGTMLGSIPSYRPGTGALVIRNGYLVGEFGDTEAVATTYSVAKSMLATVAGVAVRDGRIRNLDEPVAASVTDGGYASAQNARVTWRHHLQQESEWEGELWGKKHDFVGAEAYGSGERKPRDLQAPGTFYEYNDVRINRFALSLLRVFSKSVPDVFRDEVANVIGMSDTWQWVPYTNSYVEIDGQRMPSVSGGTRWGGGVWISAYDLARFGYLWLRGGQWAGREIVPPAYVKEALTPSEHGPDYGFLWWLHTRERAEGIPANAYEARGAGSNTIFVSPDHDLVVVWRWHGGAGASAQFFRMVIEAIN